MTKRVFLLRILQKQFVVQHVLAIPIVQEYMLESGILVQGRFIVNTLNIGENLGKDPAADRLFCNILNFASGDINKPMIKLPENFNQQLIEISYHK